MQTQRPMNRTLRYRRRGMVATVEFIFIFPLFVAVGLVVYQFLLIYAAYTRVQQAAIEGARLAAQGATIQQVEDAVGLALGYLAVGPGAAHITAANEIVGFELIQQFVDTDNDGMISPCTDYVAVGVRIPMNRVSTNYLGLLCGGSVDGLQLRSVVKMAISCNCGNGGGSGQCQLTTSNCTVCQLVVDATICYIDSIPGLNPGCRSQLVTQANGLNDLRAAICANPADNAGHCAMLSQICTRANTPPCSNSMTILQRLQLIDRLNQIANCICCPTCTFVP